MVVVVVLVGHDQHLPSRFDSPPDCILVLSFANELKDLRRARLGETCRKLSSLQFSLHMAFSPTRRRRRMDGKNAQMFPLLVDGWLEPRGTAGSKKSKGKTNKGMKN